MCPDGGPLEATRLIPRMLLDVQNRGQLSSGITSYNPVRKRPLLTYKDVGSVSEAFHQNHRERFEKIMQGLLGNAGIGHVRYATCGEDDPNYAHPYERFHYRKSKWFSFAFNGQIANFEELGKKLRSDDTIYFSLDTDAEIFMHRFCMGVKGNDNHESDLFKLCQSATAGLDGAFSLVFLNGVGEMLICRDPRGIKPLCYACDGSLFAAASESVALFNLGFSNSEIRDVPPGGCVVVKPDGSVTERLYADSPRTAHCFFEWIYFSNAASVLDGRSVYLARHRLGVELAKLEKENGFDKLPKEDRDNTIVVPVPDTSRAAAEGMAYSLGTPCLEGLMRNRYSGRTFIEGGNSRIRRAKTKYTPLPEVLAGKRVLLVEDSIVRSTTMRVLIQRILEIGKAKEVHVRVACPPVVGPCFYGTDMSTYSELFATRFLFNEYGGKEGIENADYCTENVMNLWKLTPEIEQKMAEDLGCTSLRYLPVKSIFDAIGKYKINMCHGCVTQEYPTLWGDKLAKEALLNFVEDKSGRTYE